MRVGITILVIGGIWFFWLIAASGYPSFLPFIIAAVGSVIVLINLIRKNTCRGRAISPFTRNLIGFLAWGSLASLGMFLMMTASVAMVMGRHRIHLPEIVITIWEVLYLIVGFPAIWIRPGTIFDNFTWTFLSIFIFWGVVLQGLLIAYKSRRSPT